jgi:hypothetical protein
VAALDRFLLLVRGELGLPSRTPLACLGPLPVFPGAGAGYSAAAILAPAREPRAVYKVAARELTT